MLSSHRSDHRGHGYDARHGEFQGQKDFSYCHRHRRQVLRHQNPPKTSTHNTALAIRVHFLISARVLSLIGPCLSFGFPDPRLQRWSWRSLRPSKTKKSISEYCEPYPRKTMEFPPLYHPVVPRISLLCSSTAGSGSRKGTRT